MLKNKISVILLMFALAVPSVVNAEIFSEPLDMPVQEEVVTPPVETEAVQPVQTEQVPPAQTLSEEPAEPENFAFKQPVSKRKIAKKFLLAMAGVGISSLILFLMLTLYNKLRENFTGNRIQPAQEDETPLETPGNLTDAVKTFLDKTKWD